MGIPSVYKPVIMKLVTIESFFHSEHCPQILNIVTLSYFQAGSRGTQARPRAACMGSEQVVVFTFLVAFSLV